MKQVFIIIAAFLLTANVFLSQQASAQAPETMTYHAVIRDASNYLVTSQVVGMQISILQGSSGGIAVYEETQTPTTNANGLVSLEIGSGTVVSGDFASIDWSNGPYFIKTETDPIGGTTYTLTGTSQLLSVPYAMHAKTVAGYSVGDYAHGGIIFWLDDSGQHGLVCTIEDQSAGVRWYAGYTGNVQAFVSAVYAGKANTFNIIGAYRVWGDDGNTYAARMCNELEVFYSGIMYGDWYLPSIYELQLMYVNKASIDAGAIAAGGSPLAVGDYWASHEFNHNSSAVVYFGSGGVFSVKKYNWARVRAVRAF